MMKRPDDPQGIARFQNAYYRGKALCVLGGPSGELWKQVRDEVEPDVILGANGACFQIDNLDFHLIVENMHMANGRARQGEKRYQDIMRMFTIKHHARVRMISYLSWDLVDDRTNAVCIRRLGELGADYDAQIKQFSFREYGEGFLAGPLFDHPTALSRPTMKFRVGTVGTQLIHLAGILGVGEVHTIGMDFASYYHWYKYPHYEPDKFRTDDMFTEFQGLQTQWDWIQGADWLKSIEWMFERDGLQWIDHSEGLFKAKGLRCSN